MSSGRRGPRAAVAVTAALVLLMSSGCADPSPPPAIAVNDAPADAPRFTLARPAKGGLVPGARWPKACDLITDADVRAILPEASAIDHHGQEATIEVTGHVGLARLRQITVPQRSCRIEFGLPGAGSDESAPALTRIQLDLDAVGSRRVARLNYQGTGDLVGAAGADECHRIAESRYTCRVNGVVFTLDGSAAPELRFQGQQGDTSTFYGRQVLHEFAELVAAKL